MKDLLEALTRVMPGPPTPEQVVGYFKVALGLAIALALLLRGWKPTCRRYVRA